RPNVRQPVRHRVIVGNTHMAVEAMGNSSFVVRGGPCRQDAQLAVDLHRIGIDDRTVAGPGQSERKRRLAARRWSCDKNCPSCTHLPDAPDLGQPAKRRGATWDSLAMTDSRRQLLIATC